MTQSDPTFYIAQLALARSGGGPSGPTILVGELDMSTGGMAGNSSTSFDIPVPGAIPSDLCFVQWAGGITGFVTAGPPICLVDTVRIFLRNATATTIFFPLDSLLRATVIRP